MKNRTRTRPSSSSSAKTTMPKGRQHKSAPVYGFKAVAGAPEGTFEAIVAVFNNVDFANERVMPGFFTKSLDQWRASGDPVPIIFSHQWENLDAHVGISSPDDVKELLPGDPLLPPELKALGGLYVKGALEMDEPFAARLWKKMSQRAIKEFSFAYDVTSARPGQGGALDLLEGELIEVGPTLKGMNPATALLGAKAAEVIGDPLDALELVEELEASLADEDDDPEEETETDDDTETETKSLPADAIAGSIEETLDAIRASAEVWAGLEYGNDLYALHLDATFLDESRALVTAERWQDPWGEGPVWELNYTLDDAGLVTVDDATELEVTVSFRPKSRDRDAVLISRGMAKSARSAGNLDTVDNLSTSSTGKTDEATRRKAVGAQGRGPGDVEGPTPATALAAAEVFALET